MKKFLSATIIAVSAAVLNSAVIDIVADKADAYQVGETINFKVIGKEKNKKLMSDGKFKLYVCDSDKRNVMQIFDIDLAQGNPTYVSVKTTRPGFVWAVPEANYVTADGKSIRWQESAAITRLGGAAVEPEKIRVAGNMPEDFADFWQSHLKGFEKATVTVTAAKHIKRPNYNVFIIKVDYPDNSGSIDGFLSIPAAPGKYPIVAGVPGAGSGVVTPQGLLNGTKPTIEIMMNVHAYPTAENAAEQKKRYDEFNKTCSSGAYYIENAWERDKYLYGKVWPAVSRAIDHATTLPEFDGKNIAAVGISQGGGTALALAYLNKKVTCAVSAVPALCDHNAWQSKRQPGWPQTHYVLKKRADNTMPYFDAVHFASGIKVPTMVIVGFEDQVCSPTSVYAAYNNLAGAKEIVHMQFYGHRLSTAAIDKLKAFIDREFAK